MKIRKRYQLLFVSILSASLLAIAVSVPESDSCKNEKYQTAEPGTCLDPKAYRLLKALEKVENNPYNNEFAKRVIDIFEPKIRKQVDTEVRYDSIHIPIRIYYPSKKSIETPTHVILYIHGGGFMYGSIEEYDMAVKKLAKITDKIVISLDYRLAPEYPFPAALNDISAVLNWILNNLEEIGGKGSQVIVMGDSAGANLATVLVLKLKDENKEAVLCQVLYYPPTSFLETEYPSRLYFLRDERRNYLISEEFVRRSKENYLPDSIPDDYPYVSPMYANLEGRIPASLIMTAQVDPLRDEGRIYAEKLKAAGHEVRYIEYPGVVHGFFNLYMILDAGKESMQQASDFIDAQIIASGF